MTDASWKSRFRHYTGLEKCEGRLEQLLGDFQMTTCRDVLATQGLLPAKAHERRAAGFRGDADAPWTGPTGPQTMRPGTPTPSPIPATRSTTAAHSTMRSSEAFGKPSHGLIATDGAGRSSGVLPLIRQKSLLFGDRLVSLPYANHGGPLADARRSRGLFEAAARLGETWAAAGSRCATTRRASSTGRCTPTRC
jgi:hypothetical protein